MSVCLSPSTRRTLSTRGHARASAHRPLTLKYMLSGGVVRARAIPGGGGGRSEKGALSEY